MKKLIVILILMMFCSASIPSAAYAYTRGKTHVKSYTKKNGTRVRAHSSHTYRGHGGTKHRHKR